MARIKLATCRTRCICSLHWATCCFLFNFDNSTLYFVVAVSTAQSAGQLGPIKYSMPRWRSCQLGPTCQFLSRYYSKKKFALLRHQTRDLAVQSLKPKHYAGCLFVSTLRNVFDSCCLSGINLLSMEKTMTMPVYPHSLYWSSRNDNLGTTFQKELWI